MARPKKEQGGDIPASAKPKKIDLGKLSEADQIAVVEEYLGVHPRYFLYEGAKIRLDLGLMSYDKVHFNGWKPNEV